MAMIISDIHGDIKKAKAFLAYKPEAEHVILGDLMDSRDRQITLKDELACLELILASDAVLIWGNHDLAYTILRPWRDFTRFVGMLPSSMVEQYKDRSDYLRRCYEDMSGNLLTTHIFTDLIQSHADRFKAAYAVDDWLCTHAGLSKAVTTDLPDMPIGSGDSEEIARFLNEEFLRESKIQRKSADPLVGGAQLGEDYFGVGPLFARDWTRSGDDAYGGIFWYDHQHELPKPDPRVKQIFGHAPVPGPLRRDLWNNINIESGCWVFDTTKNDFVMLDEKTMSLTE